MLALGADLSLFMIGLSFASPTTILPAFAAHLGAPNVVIGAIPALMTVGWALPSLFAAGHTETLRRKLPFVMRYTLWERAPFLVLALAAFALAERSPGLTLATLLAMLLLITGTGGLLMPAWLDIVGRTIPTTLRGRFFAVSSTLASAGGLAGSFGTAAILGVVPPPQSYGVCFLLCTVFMALSYWALAVTREPETVTVAAPTTLGTYLRRMPPLLGRDVNFRWFLIARGAALLGTMATGFYTVYALRAWETPAWQVGVFTTMFFSGQVIGNLVLGWLADRAGHRLVIIVGVAALAIANVIALSAVSLGVFTVVFGLAGLSQAAHYVSGMSIILEFPPSADERPTYVGLGNTLVTPAAFGAPLVAGAMADGFGFGPVFSVAALFGLIGLAILVACVREPRRAHA